MTDIQSRGYVKSDVLVSTEWVASNLNNPAYRIIESNEDPLLYPSGHIPGAVQVDWTTDLNDPLRRDYLDKAGFDALASRIGITQDTTVIFYGDKNNWWATYAFWVFQLFGFDNTVVLDGGRAKWLAEERETTEAKPTFVASHYVARERDDSRIRAYFADTKAHMQAGLPMVDVRSPQEYTGEKLHMPDYPQEGTLRGGHIPGARSMPWAKAAEADGSFKTADALRGLYEGELGLRAADTVVTYCRIGERSSHTWFVLTYLLGYTNVRNYDGSWTEWGNAVRAPIRKGEQP